MKSKNATIKKVKGYSSAYPNICNLKLLPNIDGGWITIQDDVGTSMTIKLSDLSDFIGCEECRAKKQVEDLIDSSYCKERDQGKFHFYAS